MEITNNKNKTNYTKEEIRMNGHLAEKVAHRPKHPVPPHERKGMINIQFDDQDWTMFNNIFGDQDTAAAAIDIVYGAPPEIQILVAQIIKMIEKEVA